jgi:predicted nucleic acid-binding protein
MARLTCVPVDADLVLRDQGRAALATVVLDALMVAAARQAGCDRLLTEDLSGGASYDGLRVKNPFRGTDGQRLVG